MVPADGQGAPPGHAFGSTERAARIIGARTDAPDNPEADHVEEFGPAGDRHRDCRHVVLAGAAPAFAVTNRWAWVVARHPSTASYIPASLDQGSSESAAANSVARSSVGRYVVTIGNQGDVATNGTVHVTAMGSQANFCNVNGWGPSGPDLTASVRCFDRTGSRTDSQFVIVFQMTELRTTAGRRTSGPTNHEPHLPARRELFLQLARRPELGHARLRWQVLRQLRRPRIHEGQRAGDDYGDHRVACRASRWYESSGNELVIVLCRDPLGHPVNSRFDLTFVQGQGLKGQFGAPAAYLWANRPTSASYHPDPAYRWSAPGARPTVGRTNAGVYSVKLPSMPRGGAALVTPTGTGKARCVIASIRTAATPQRIGVRCFNVAGAPADAPFALSYLK